MKQHVAIYLFCIVRSKKFVFASSLLDTMLWGEVAITATATTTRGKLTSTTSITATTTTREIKTITKQK